MRIKRLGNLLLLIVLLALLAAVIPARAGWGDCGSPAVAGADSDFRWERLSATEFALWVNGDQVGNYRTDSHAYQPRLAPGVWGEPTACPVAAPPAQSCQCCSTCNCDEECNCSLGTPCGEDCHCIVSASKPAVDPVQFPGVVKGQEAERPTYRINGREVSRREVFEKLAATVPDDRNKLSLTFAGGTEAERKAALEAAASIGLTRDCLVQALPAESPLLKKGFVTSGHPTVYLQTPDGRPLIRRQDASLESLQLIAQQVAAYDPTKDPTGDGFTLADLEKKIAAVPAWVWFIAGAVLVLALHKRQSPPLA